MIKAVFLDRDGVVNKALVKNGKAYSPRRFNEFEFQKDIAGQIKKIKDAGYRIIVVSNQPDIARGKMNVSELNKMTESIQTTLPVDEILICRHDDRDQCNCRKPKPGMLLTAANKFNINLSRSFMIGDGWKDMEAAKNAGCKGILIDTCYNQGIDCFMRVQDMSEAIDIILNVKGEN